MGKKRTKDIINLFINKEFYLFLIIGFINTFNGVLFALIFSYYLDAKTSFILGYIISLTIAYLLNSLIIFKKQLKIIRYFKFCISYIPNFIIQLFLVIILIDIFGINKLLVYIISAIIGVPITYLIIKFYALKK